MIRAIQANKKDNVATLVFEGKTQDVAMIKDENTEKEITLKSNIPAFHKLALEDISLGEQVIKYGEVIGIATSEIQCGEYVHVHNVESNRGRGDKAGGQ